MKNGLFDAKQKYSIRKYSFGVTSVLLGTFILLSGLAVSADEVVTDSSPTVAMVTTATSPTVEEQTGVAKQTQVVEKQADEQYATDMTVMTVVVESQEELAESSNTVDEAKVSLNSASEVVTTQINDNVEKSSTTTVSPSTENSNVQINRVVETGIENPQNSVNVSTENYSKESLVVDKKQTELDNIAAEKTTEPSLVGKKEALKTTTLGISKFSQLNAMPVSANLLAVSRVASTSIAKGDDYPSNLKNATPDSVIDPWRLYNRECTSFTAYRLSSVNKFELPGAYGNGAQWGGRAQREGYRVDMNPAKGSVAWLNDGGYGHVAWVSNVIGDNVEIEEYNYNYNHSYNKRTVAKSRFTGYIHFKDLGTSSISPSPTTNTDGEDSTIPASGTYTFKSRSGIKSDAKISSPDIAYYDAGQSVNYDKTMIADGYQWISYTAYSGARRYIAVNKIQQAVTPVVKGTIKIINKNDQNGTFDVVISDVSSNAGLKEVQVPTWSEQNGQDDIIWYKATKQSDGSYKISVNIANHKNNRGDYNVHVYYVIDSGKQVGVGGTKVTVANATSQTNQTTGIITIQNKNNTTGTFDVIISNVNNPGGIKEVNVPVWATQNGQDDIVWYSASKQNNGTYKVTVKASDHKNYKGEYNIHLYYQQSNGEMIPVAGTTTKVDFVSKPSIPNSGTYIFTGRSSIKAEPKMSSAELAYYDAGNSVNYDSLVQSDDHYWISYIASSGNRRYISIT